MHFNVPWVSLCPWCVQVKKSWWRPASLLRGNPVTFLVVLLYFNQEFDAFGLTRYFFITMLSSPLLFCGMVSWKIWLALMLTKGRSTIFDLRFLICFLVSLSLMWVECSTLRHSLFDFFIYIEKIKSLEVDTEWDGINLNWFLILKFSLQTKN